MFTPHVEVDIEKRVVAVKRTVACSKHHSSARDDPIVVRPTLAAEDPHRELSRRNPYLPD